jgi:hypothetical protein
MMFGQALALLKPSTPGRITPSANSTTAPAASSAARPSIPGFAVLLAGRSGGVEPWSVVVPFWSVVAIVQPPSAAEIAPLAGVARSCPIDAGIACGRCKEPSPASRLPDRPPCR